MGRMTLYGGLSRTQLGGQDQVRPITGQIFCKFLDLTSKNLAGSDNLAINVGYNEEVIEVAAGSRDMERSICCVFCFHNLNIYLSVQHVSKKCIHAVTNPYVTFDRATEQRDQFCEISIVQGKTTCPICLTSTRVQPNICVCVGAIATLVMPYFPLFSHQHPLRYPPNFSLVPIILLGRQLY